MTLPELRKSLSSESPPENLDICLRALWHDAKGDWEKAHNLAQQDSGPSGAWIHAYLHRKEGDQSNALYWYSKAGRKPSGLELEREWEEIAQALLTAHQ